MAQAARRLGRGRRGHRRDLDRQDRHRRRGARRRPAGGDRRRRGRDRRRRHRAGADRHRREAGRGAHVGGDERGRRRARRPRRRRRPARRHRHAPRRLRAAARERPRRARPALLAGRDADGGRARPRPLADRGHRPRRPRAQAGRARVSWRRKPEPPMHIESPYKPDRGAAARPGRGGRREPVADAPDDRPRDGRVAADGGDLHDDRRGGHDPRRGGAQGARHHGAADRRPGDDRDAAAVPRAERDAGRRRLHRPRGRPPRHRGLARRGGPDRPGDPRRPGALRGGPVEAHQGALEAPRGRTS